MSNYSSLRLLPNSVIQAAKAGDAEAIGTVLHYYDAYMNSLCQKPVYETTAGDQADHRHRNHEILTSTSATLPYHTESRVH